MHLIQVACGKEEKTMDKKIVGLIVVFVLLIILIFFFRGKSNNEVQEINLEDEVGNVRIEKDEIADVYKVYDGDTLIYVGSDLVEAEIYQENGGFDLKMPEE